MVHRRWIIYDFTRYSLVSVCALQHTSEISIDHHQQYLRRIGCASPGGHFSFVVIVVFIPFDINPKVEEFDS